MPALEVRVTGPRLGNTRNHNVHLWIALEGMDAEHTVLEETFVFLPSTKNRGNLKISSRCESDGVAMCFGFADLRKL